MTDKEKLQKILLLLIDKEAYKFRAKENLSDEEAFGALMFAGHVFGQAYKIANK